MLHDGNLRAEQDRVGRSCPVAEIVDVDRVDAHQPRTRIAEALTGIRSKKWIADSVGLGSPVPIPTGAHQHCLTTDIAPLERTPVDLSICAWRNRNHHGLETRHYLEGQGGQVLPLRVTMKGAVEVRTRVPNHLELADLELNAACISLAGSFPA